MHQVFVDPESCQRAFRNSVSRVDLPNLPEPIIGKVRESYDIDGERRLLIATDRLSAFDRNLTTIPFKGQVLTQLSQFWFEKTADLCPNHMIAVPDPNVMVCKRLRMLPVEVVVRGYLAGTTSTSLLAMYRAGHRRLYGQDLGEGMRDNELLARPMITPTTKGEAGAHDVALDPTEVVTQGYVDARTWTDVCERATALFAAGQAWARRCGLILVDTKYEFGLDEVGDVVVADEIHTPDSSRYWDATTYQDRFEQGQAPDSFDKDRVRRWVRARCDPYKDEIPEIPDAIRAETASAYLEVFERLTGTPLVPPTPDMSAQERIERAVADYLG